MSTPEQPSRGTAGTPGTPGSPSSSGPLGSDVAPPSAGRVDGATGPVYPPERSEPAARRAARGIGRTLALALLIFVTVILVLFVVFNTQTVEISLVFGDVQAPLVLALVVAAVLGGLVVGLLSLLRRARRGSR